MRFLLLTLVLIFGHGLMGCSQGHLQQDQLIVGGKELSYSDRVADYIVHISLTDSFGYNQVCTGVFVSENAILTAKHCNEGNVSVTFRTSDYKKEGEVTNLTIIGSQPVAVPEDVREKLILMYFSEAFPEKAKIADISTFSALAPRSQFYVAGYGLSNPDKDDLNNNLAYSDKPHYKEMNMAYVTNADGYFEIDQTQTQGGACRGDSGGPVYFMHPQTKRMQLIGIVSAVGENCADKSYIIKTEFLNLQKNQEVK